MRKTEVIWLIIRVVGLYFLWQSVETVIALVANFKVASATPGLLANSGGVFMQLIFKAGLYCVLGLYCVGDGRVFFHVLDKESDNLGGPTAPA
ncbi:MAG TPA: hypothetical protein VM936_13810 [Pyrinomonadaceae bacterium]|jgi:hypothetical protein|nr:hypothetical protein [Pyrinomonadaceae bacterium]